MAASAGTGSTDMAASSAAIARVPSAASATHMRRRSRCVAQAAGVRSRCWRAIRTTDTWTAMISAIRTAVWMICAACARIRSGCRRMVSSTGRWHRSRYRSPNSGRVRPRVVAVVTANVAAAAKERPSRSKLVVVNGAR